MSKLYKSILFLSLALLATSGALSYAKYMRKAYSSINLQVLPQQFTVTTSVTNGNLTINNENLTSKTFTNNSQVTVKYSPNENYYLYKIKINDRVYNVGDEDRTAIQDSYTFNITEPTSIDVEYKPIEYIDKNINITIENDDSAVAYDSMRFSSTNIKLGDSWYKFKLKGE